MGASQIVAFPSQPLTPKGEIQPAATIWNAPSKNEYMPYRIIYTLCLFLGLFSCGNENQLEKNVLFQEIQVSTSQVDFTNTLAVNDSMNFFKYGYFYMGGGVAAGDLNGDTLADLFFTANMEDNRLYLNKGQLVFDDISIQSGIESTNKWHTGCSLTDINSDGKLDIYVSVAGIWNDRNNLLYINQGNDSNGIPLFEEKAAEYGLDDEGYSIQTAFFDYDNDGDLDVYVVNYPPTSFDSKVLDYRRLTENVTLNQSDHLYKNNGDNTFTDVTIEAGLMKFGLGIGVVTTDINQDGYQDIYVSNDFHTPDFFYLNNGNGTFTESLEACFQHTSFYGMGVDIADLNNDLLVDLFQVDMSSSDNYRSKANMSSMNIPAFWAGIDAGFHYQYMYNSLQMNNGISTENLPFFSDIAMANNIHTTDWSWTGLLADFDNDGRRDIFVSNGTRKDINNKDYFKWLNQTDTKLKVRFKELSFADLTDNMSSKKMDNYIFKNQGDTFVKNNEEWGLKYEGFSNGAAYVDLDNDGDLEIVVNNIDSTAAIFKNLATENGQNYFKLSLKGPLKNTLGLGSKVYLYADSLTLYADHTLVRGYQSSIDPVLHFGLGAMAKIDSLKIVWPDQTVSRYLSLKPNQTLYLDHKDNTGVESNIPKNNATLFTAQPNFPIAFKHTENEFDDYKREILLPHKMSSLGPGIAKADINHDGQDDLLCTGAKGQASVIYKSRIETDGTVTFEAHELSDANKEDVNASFTDINNDGHLDVILASGGNEEDNLSDDYYNQRFYLNDGHGNYSTPQLIHADLRISAAVIAATDLDKDGQQELFIGGRQIPGVYPSPANSYIFRSGEDVTEQVAPDLHHIGMITDAIWSDFDQDDDDDLILVGEWMGITILENDGGKLSRKTIPSLSDQVGWWKTISAADFDNDGDIDYLVGNLGLNYKYKGTDDETFDIYAHDFDQNDNQDIVLGFYQDGVQYPVRGRQCSSEQIPEISNKFPNYHYFASSSLDQIYEPESLEKSIHYQANNFKHLYIENKGNGILKSKPLPAIFQRYSINAIAPYDFNDDGYLDVVMAGNIFDSEVETSRSDAGFGLVAFGNGKGDFRLLTHQESGLYIPFETQDIETIMVDGKLYVLFANNDAMLSVWTLDKGLIGRE